MGLAPATLKGDDDEDDDDDDDDYDDDDDDDDGGGGGGDDDDDETNQSVRHFRPANQSVRHFRPPMIPASPARVDGNVEQICWCGLLRNERAST